jgi:hypothetical protein
MHSIAKSRNLLKNCHSVLDTESTVYGVILNEVKNLKILARHSCGGFNIPLVIVTPDRFAS